MSEYQLLVAKIGRLLHFCPSCELPGHFPVGHCGPLPPVLSRLSVKNIFLSSLFMPYTVRDDAESQTEMGGTFGILSMLALTWHLPFLFIQAFNC